MTRLERPSFTKNMNTYFLRDEFFEFAVFNKTMAEAFKTQLLVSDKGHNSYQNIYDQYLSAAVPWEWQKKQLERELLAQKFHEDKDKRLKKK